MQEGGSSCLYRKKKSPFFTTTSVSEGRTTGITLLCLSGSCLEYIQPPPWPLPLASGYCNALLLFGWAGGMRVHLGRGLLLSDASQLLQNTLVCPVAVPGCRWLPSAQAALRCQLSSGPCPLCLPRPCLRVRLPAPRPPVCLVAVTAPRHACPGFACDTP